MRDMDDLFAALRQSEFRSRFRLSGAESVAARKKSRSTLRAHAHDLITLRLAPASPANDGRQTPMRGHPVFVAQHATATCCRKCLSKWHGIGSGRTLSAAEVDYVVQVIEHWIIAQLDHQDTPPPDPQRRLFPT